MGEEMSKIGIIIGFVLWVVGIFKSDMDTQILGILIVVMFQTFKLENDISDIKKEVSK